MSRTWEPAAEEWLGQKTGCMPLCMIVSEYAKAAKRKGWKPRGESAIEAKASRMGESTVPELDNLSQTALAEVLGVCRRRILHWQGMGMPINRVNTRRSYIRFALFRNWLKEHPELAIDIDEDRLAFVVGKEVAEEITELNRFRSGLPHTRPILHRQSGRVYANMVLTAEVFKTTKDALNSALGRKKRNGVYQLNAFTTLVCLKTRPEFWPEAKQLIKRSAA